MLVGLSSTYVLISNSMNNNVNNENHAASQEVITELQKLLKTCKIKSVM